MSSPSGLPLHFASEIVQPLCVIWVCMCNMFMERLEIVVGLDVCTVALRFHSSAGKLCRLMVRPSMRPWLARHLDNASTCWAKPCSAKLKLA